jgi:hypothetical protein
MKSKRITLCGSTKFKKEFEAINRQLSLEGNVVYSVAFFAHADNVPLTPDQKTQLDTVHKMKIDNSDGIFVIDVDGYIGESTRNEIEYAEMQGKFVKYLHEFPDLKTICDYEAMKPSASLLHFLNWYEKLNPTDKVSVWSKDGQYKGLFNKDNEQMVTSYFDHIRREEKRARQSEQTISE